MKISAWIILLFVLLSICYASGGSLLAAGKKEPGTGDNPSISTPAYTIGIGDVLQVFVWNEADLTMPVLVRLDGFISMPLIGDIKAAGVSPVALAATLRKEIARFVADPTVSVILQESRSKQYYVLGQISKPGEYPLDYPITILQALAKAGGLLEWADKKEIKIVRRTAAGEKIIPFNYNKMLEGEDLEQNVLIETGDTLIIP